MTEARLDEIDKSIVAHLARDARTSNRQRCRPRITASGASTGPRTLSRSAGGAQRATARAKCSACSRVTGVRLKVPTSVTSFPPESVGMKKL